MVVSSGYYSAYREGFLIDAEDVAGGISNQWIINDGRPE